MQSVSSRIWTRDAVSISCDDNQYTTGTSIVTDIILSKEMTETMGPLFYDFKIS